MHRLTAFLSLAVLSEVSSASALATRNTVTCYYSAAASNGDTCESFAASWGLDLDTFESFNPNVKCPSLVSGQSYCVTGVVSAGGPTTTSAPTSTHSTTPSSIPSTTSTTAGNGIQTPLPIQPGMVGNCNKFHYIYPGNTCGQITSYSGISQQDFARWNPQIGDKCTGLQANANACVGVLGGTPTSTASTTSTTPGNGVQTPLPIQPGMVGNCNKFHYIYPGNTCSQITSYSGISQQDFARWNPQIGDNCSGLQANANACVGVLDAPSVQGPQPQWPGIASNCKKYYLVKSDDSCYTIGASQGISLQQIRSWNSKVDDKCDNLWLGYNICVGV